MEALRWKAPTRTGEAAKELKAVLDAADVTGTVESPGRAWPWPRRR
jgi:hypothetical protein